MYQLVNISTAFLNSISLWLYNLLYNLPVYFLSLFDVLIKSCCFNCHTPTNELVYIHMYVHVVAIVHA